MSHEPIRPFEIATPPKPGLMDRLIGRVSREAVFVEIRNHLATTPFDQIRESDVTDILVKGKLLCADAKMELSLIFEHAALILAADRELSAGDRNGLLALQCAFELTDEEVKTATENSIGNVFERTMREALSDGRFTEDEKQRLKATSKSLGMSDAQTHRLYGSAALATVQSAFSTATSDRRYTQVEEERVLALAKSLGVKIAHDEATTALVARFKLFAEIEEGNLPSVPVSVLLKRRENCHFATPATHSQIRTVTQRVNYGGPTASIRIMKGVRYRVGSISVQRITSDVMTQVDNGTLYITSSRLLFDGTKKNTSIPLGKMTGFTVFKDGLKIEKDTGSDQYFLGAADWELAGACLDAAAVKLR